MTSHYPRDLIGYGRTPPHANWPGKAKIAVQFVLNYEEGGENCVTAWGMQARSSFVRDHWCSQLSRPPFEHGVHLRIRLPRWRVAYSARVRAPRVAAHRIWRGHGARAPPGRGPGIQRAGP